MLNLITPLILTYNEAPNIERVLDRLRWARDIVVVDSFSDDETIEIASNFQQVRSFQRRFDNHCAQWSFGLNETGISTEWVLALDADYVLTPKFVDELRSLQTAVETNGYQADFAYCINGRSLRSGLLPLSTVLYRRNCARYEQDGHTQRLIVDGKIETLGSRILHDDRKPLSRWFQSQQRYMALEAKKIVSSDAETLGIADRVRRLRVIAPLTVLFYCLVVRRGVLDGWAGFYYAFQRMLAELLLSLYLLEHDLNGIGKRKLVATEPQSHGASAEETDRSDKESVPPALAGGSVR